MNSEIDYKNRIQEFEDLASKISNHNPLYYKSIVYDYYAKLDADVDLSMLDIIYELSQLFSRTRTRFYARKLVESKLKRGEIIAPELFASAGFSKRSNYEIILAMLYYCRERDYEKALNCLETIKGKKRLEYGNLHALILNRLKKLEQANEELAACVSAESNKKKLNILYSYYVTNYIHLGLREQVEEHFITAYQELTGSENHGYFSRNMASAVSVDEIEKRNTPIKGPLIILSNIMMILAYTVLCVIAGILCA